MRQCTIFTLILAILVSLSLGCQKKIPKKEDEKEGDGEKKSMVVLQQLGSATLQFVNAKPGVQKSTQSANIDRGNKAQRRFSKNNEQIKLRTEELKRIENEVAGETLSEDEILDLIESGVQIERMDRTDDNNGSNDQSADPPSGNDPTSDPPAPPGSADPTSDPSSDPSPIPADVKFIKVTVTGEGIAEPLVSEFDLSKTKEFKIAKIPAGTQRKFTIEALNEAKEAKYTGEGLADIKANEETQVQIQMKKKEGGGGDEGTAGIIILWPAD